MVLMIIGPHMSICTLYIHTVEYLNEPSDYDNEDHVMDYGTDDHRSIYAPNVRKFIACGKMLSS